jgi:hypothetical protein
MSLTDKETHQKDEVLFSGSMRHRKLPRARRRKKRAPEITAPPVGMIDPLTGEITVPDEADDLSEANISSPDEVIYPTTDNDTVREAVINPLANDSTVREDIIDSAAEDMIIPDDSQDYDSSDDLLWTDLDDADTDEDNESDDEVDVPDFSAGTDIEDTYRHDITDAEEVQTAAKAKEMRKAEASDKDMFLADIEDENTEVESEDDLDD